MAVTRAVRGKRLAGEAGAVRGALPRWRRGQLWRWFRNPAVWWSVTVVVALLSVGALAVASADVQERQRAWGETQRVAVVVTPVDVGAAVVDAVEWRDQPSAVIAQTAVESLAADQVARFPLVVGQVVLDQHVMTGGAALARNLPPGTAALALPTGTGWPELSVGDRVDLLATFPLGAGTPDTDEATQRVSKGAVVVDLGDRVVTIAVPEDQVTTVAHALARAVILAVLVPIS